MDIFQIASTDMSIQMLYYIFSPIMDVLMSDASGAESLMANAFAAGFNVFNAAVLFLGAVYVIVHSASAVLRTAHEGEVMGKSWSSMWVPLRLSLGFAILLPLSNGYSLVQGGVMWFAMSGAGLANSVVSVMIEEMTPRNNVSIAMKANDVYPLAEDIFIAMSCLASSAKAIRGERAINADLPQDTLDKVDFDYTITQTTSLLGNPEGVSIEFGDKSGVFGKSMCGSIEVNSSDVSENFSDMVHSEDGGRTQSNFQHVSNSVLGFFGSTEQDKMKNEMVESFQGAYLSSMETMVSDIEGLVGELYKPNGGTKDAHRQGDNMTALFKISQDFNGNMISWMEEAATSANIDSVWDAYIEKHKSDGWVALGGMYVRLAKINDDFSRIADVSPTSSHTSTGSNIGCWWRCGISKHLDPAKESGIVYAETVISEWKNYLDSNPNIKRSLLAKNASSGTIVSDYSKDEIPDSFEGIITEVAGKVLLGPINAILKNSLIKYDDSGETAGDSFLSGARSPVIVAKEFGDGLLTGTSSALGILAAAKAMAQAADTTAQTATGGVGAIATPFTGYAMGLLSIAVPILLILLTGLMFFGATLAIYIPMVPFIIWVGGIVSWLVTILEAMIVAPIWAISFLSPEGEGFAGQRAEQGFLLILSIFLRPVLMVFGFFAALTVSFVVFGYIFTVFSEVFESTQDGFSLLIVFLGKVIIFTILMMTTMNSIYQLIHIIPDRVLRWIGGGQEALGDMQTEQSSKAAFGAVIGAGSSATQSTTANLAGRDKAAKPDNKTEPETDPTGGDNAGGDTNNTEKGAGDDTSSTEKENKAPPKNEV